MIEYIPRLRTVLDMGYAISGLDTITRRDKTCQESYSRRMWPCMRSYRENTLKLEKNEGSVGLK